METKNFLLSSLKYIAYLLLLSLSTNIDLLLLTNLLTHHKLTTNLTALAYIRSICDSWRSCRILHLYASL